MAKSIRSKSKRSYRAKKRESGIYAATEAARLNRLNARLAAIASKEGYEQDDPDKLGEKDEEMLDLGGDVQNDTSDDIAVDTEPVKRVATHGARSSRREEWRKSKGLDPIPKRGMNRQGGLAARRKAGRSKRRR